VIGVDANPEMEPYLKRAGAGVQNLEVIHGDIEELPLPTASVDAVICTLVRIIPQGCAAP
jgi:ubiquinone/menaquinone biosynthesis C-methylase UbiE